MTALKPPSSLSADPAARLVQTRGEALAMDCGAHFQLNGLTRPPGGVGPARVLVVMCHGASASGRQMLRFAAAWRDVAPDAAFVAPHAPFACRSRRSRLLRAAGLASFAGRQWFSLVDRSAEAEYAGVATAARLLDRYIDAELDLHGLTPDAVVLMGFSQGAIVALSTGLRRAVAPRAILSFSGGVPKLARFAQDVRNSAPVLLVHGEADKVLPADRSYEAARLLQGQDVPVELVLLPLVGHIVNQAGIVAGARFLRQAMAR